LPAPKCVRQGAGRRATSACFSKCRKSFNVIESEIPVCRRIL
jgi:hypothetical protein